MDTHETKPAGTGASGPGFSHAACIPADRVPRWDFTADVIDPV
jgi:hypothetical protein